MFTSVYAFLAVGGNQDHHSEANHRAGKSKFNPEAAVQAVELSPRQTTQKATISTVSERRLNFNHDFISDPG